MRLFRGPPRRSSPNAGVIAEYLRLRFHLLKPLRPFSDQTKALRAAVRARADLVGQRTTANDQLEATLDAFWPGAKKVFFDVISPIALAFLQRYPTPASAAKLGEAQKVTRGIRASDLHPVRGPDFLDTEELRAVPDVRQRGAKRR